MRPQLVCDDPRTAELLVPCWEMALDVLERNTSPEGWLRAGGGYPTPWTRDAALNAWSAASWVAPETAARTLLEVTDVTDGARHVQRDTQWWDKVIWVIGAWEHAQVSGDAEFLRLAYDVGGRLLDELADRLVDGLYRGPSFFNDGIAGYPAPPAAADDAGSSGVLDYAGTDQLAALSTNCLYVGALRALRAMAVLLGDTRRWPVEPLVEQVRRRLLPHYLLLPDGSVDRSQEASGLALAALFGVVSPHEARLLLSSATRMPHGLPSIWPHFPRYSAERPGRHNAIVWPQVQGLWVRAAAQCGAFGVAAQETEALARLVAASGGFYEIYDGSTGEVSGGWQNGWHWRSEPDQTWSATAFLGMVLHGVLGLRATWHGVAVAAVGGPWGDCTVTGLPYRGRTLTVQRSQDQVTFS